MRISFRVRHDHYIHEADPIVLAAITRLEQAMSVLTAKLDELQAAIEGENPQVAALLQKIADLQTQVAAGLVTEAELARLTDLINQVKAIAPDVEIPLPPEPTPADPELDPDA